MKKVFKIISWELYPLDVIFTLGTTTEEIINYIGKKTTYKLDDEEKKFLDVEGRLGRTVMLKGGPTVLWVKYNDGGTITHEVFHAVCFLFDKIGIKFDNNIDDEAWAYAIEFLVRKISKICASLK